MPTDRVFHVLVVEDDPDELNLLCQILHEEGLHAIGCESAGKALEHVQQRDFGVAVVDYRLPDLSGTQLLEQIRSFDDQVRVIIYTGVGTYNSVKEALNLGAFAYLEKLSDRSELLRHVHKACRERVDRYAVDLERAVALRTEELARSNRELEDFASIAAHDLRSPLLTISGYCQLIHEDYGERLDATARDYLGQIVAGAARMDRLIDDLLEYSRVGRSRRPFERVVMQSVLAQALANLEASIRQRNARIEVGEMPTVTGDHTQLVEVFQNLIANAVKFCRRETPWVRVGASLDGEGWQFTVRDNGIGIEQKDFERVFQMFQRPHGREYAGTGVGLAICKKIVELHGGRIWLESVVGQGTTFSFTLPDRENRAAAPSFYYADCTKSAFIECQMDNAIEV